MIMNVSYIKSYIISNVFKCLINIRSLQGPGHCHMTSAKSWHAAACCTNNAEEWKEDGDGYAGSTEGFQSKNGEMKAHHEAVQCELGIRYPTPQAILSGKRNIQTTLVRYIVCDTDILPAARQANGSTIITTDIL